MKTNHLQKFVAVLLVAVWVASGTTAEAQNLIVTGGSAAATVNASAPHLSYGVAQILQLGQAKVGDDTIIAFIKNTRNSYALNAEQIIYLRQQGISDAVITTMLNQPRAGGGVIMPTTSAPAPVASTGYAGQVSTATVAPSQYYVQTVPDTTYYPETYYYSAPYTCYPYHYYPGYAWFPPVTIGWGWGGGWYHGGGRYHSGGYHGGGYHGGGYRGGGYRGGGHGGGHR